MEDMRDIRTFTDDRYKEYLEEVGRQLVGKKAQSRLLTEISDNGGRRFQAAQEITDFEIVTVDRSYDLMVTLGGDSVFYDTLFNIK